MRRTTAAASVVTVLVPLLLAGASTASATAGGSLTVRTPDRSGKPVHAQVAVCNTKSDDFRYVEDNKKAPLPNGSHELATSFVGGNEDVVLGGHSVQVSGATTTTFDGRTGRAVEVSLSPNPGSGYDHGVSAAVCATGNGICSVAPHGGNRSIGRAVSSGCTNARTDVAAGAADRWTSRTAAVRRAVHTAAHQRPHTLCRATRTTRFPQREASHRTAGDDGGAA
ncbi:hypothetical protein ACIHEJ_36655 [Streptomyces sp. NPDC052301]|uniref:hypothetical protein n=1 Tax=Streptomyces sp. NPDC052301 TaxID=3365687 RepID=UPI0037CE63B1